MQSLLMLLALPPLITLAAMYNGWKFRSFDRGRYLVKYQAQAADSALDRAPQRGKGNR